MKQDKISLGKERSIWKNKLLTTLVILNLIMLSNYFLVYFSTVEYIRIKTVAAAIGLHLILICILYWRAVFAIGYLLILFFVLVISALSLTPGVDTNYFLL